jgi:hypothetical protein
LFLSITVIIYMLSYFYMHQQTKSEFICLGFLIYFFLFKCAAKLLNTVNIENHWNRWLTICFGNKVRVWPKVTRVHLCKLTTWLCWLLFQERSVVNLDRFYCFTKTGVTANTKARSQICTNAAAYLHCTRSECFLPFFVWPDHVMTTC